MTMPPDWRAISFSKIKDLGIEMQCRYSISLPLGEIDALKDQKYEHVTRDGLGDWNMIGVEAGSSNFFLFGSPAHEEDAGASLWTNLTLPLEEITRVVQRLAKKDDFYVILSE